MKKLLKLVLIAFCLVVGFGTLTTGFLLTNNFNEGQSLLTKAENDEISSEAASESYFTIDSSGTITAYTGTYTNLEVPGTIDGITVKAIGANVFKSNSVLQTVVLPTSCTSIGTSAFQGCTTLTKITANGVTSIGSNAFAKINYNSATSLTTFVGTALKSVGSSAFSSCSQLTAINLSGVTTIGSSAFSNCTKLASINLSSVQTIGDSAFWCNYALTTVSIPSSCTSIGTNAFSYCHALTSISVNSSNQYYYADGSALYGKGVIIAFARGKYYSTGSGYTCKSSVTIGGSTYTITTINAYAFQSSKFYTISLPTSLKTIGESAFYGCSNLTSFTIPKTVTSMSGSSFSGCSNLSSVHVEGGSLSYYSDNGRAIYSSFGELVLYAKASVDASGNYAYTVIDYIPPEVVGTQLEIEITSIGASAFYGSKIESVTLPASCATIKTEAFESCTSLVYINAPGVVTLSGGYCFAYCYSLESLKTQSASGTTGAFFPVLTTLASDSFKSCIGLKTVSLTTAITSIPNYCFQSCSVLNYIYAKNVTSVSTCSFESCSSLPFLTSDDTDATSATSGGFFPALTTMSGSYNFDNCDGLTYVDLPTLETLATGTFYGCDHLESVKLTNSSLQSIPTQGFYSCVRLKYVYAPNVTSVSTNAFTSCQALNTVTSESGGDSATSGGWFPALTTVGGSAFYDCDGLTSVYSTKISSLGTSSFESCNYLTSVKLTSSSLSQVLTECFADCTRLNYFYAPNVKSVNTSAFYNCDALKTVTSEAGGASAISGGWFPALTTVGASAFYDCDKLETVYSDIIYSLGDSSFASCDKLNDVDLLNNSLITISSSCFKDCINLIDVYCPNVVIIGQNAFQNCSSINLVTTGEGSSFSAIFPKLKTIGVMAFYNCDGLLNVFLPTLTSLGQDSFADCGALWQVVLENSGLTTIPVTCFRNCVSLSTINAPYVQTIGISAFENCSSITVIVDGSAASSTAYFGDLQAIGKYAFSNCDGLNYANLTYCLTIDESAFEGCDIVHMFNLPSVTTLGKNVFKNCVALEMAYLNDLTTLTEGTFYGCKKLYEVDLPKVETVGSQAFYDCEGLTALTNVFPNNDCVSLPALKTVGSQAFSECSALATVDLPTVTTIGEYSFYNCAALTSVDLPALTTISSYAFAVSSACSGLQEFTIGESVATIGGAAFQNRTMQNLYFNPTNVSGNLGPLTVTDLHIRKDIAGAAQVSASFKDVSVGNIHIYSKGTTFAANCFDLSSRYNVFLEFNDAVDGSWLTHFMATDIVVNLGEADVSDDGKGILYSKNQLINDYYKYVALMIHSGDEISGYNAYQRGYTIEVSAYDIAHPTVYGGGYFKVGATDYGDHAVLQSATKISQTFTILNKNAYAAVGVEVNGSSVGNVSTYTLTYADTYQTVVAKFELQGYVVEVVCGTNGTFEVLSEAVEIETGKYQVIPSVEFEVKFIANTGYNVDTLSCDGTPQTITKASEVTYSIASVNSPKTIEATFAKIVLTIAINCGEFGQITSSSGTIFTTSGTDSVEYGDSRTYTIKPTAVSHKIGKVAVDGTEQTLNSVEEMVVVLSNVINNDRSVLAEFVVRTYEISVSFDASGGIVTPDTQIVNYGDDFEFEIRPDKANGYRIEKIVINGLNDIAEALDESVLENNYKYKFVNVTENKSLEATFVLRTYTIVLNFDGQGSLSAVDGSLDVQHGSDKEINVNPDKNDGYEIKSLKVGGVDKTSDLSADDILNGCVYVISNVQSDTQVFVTFGLRVYVITTTCGTGGTLTPEGGTNEVEHGKDKIYTITPTSIDGYRIDSVLVDGYEHFVDEADKFGEITVKVEGVVANGRTIAVTFVLRTYTVTASTDGNGTITPTSTTIIHNESVTFHITPDADHREFTLFKGTDEISTNSGECDISVVITDHSVFYVEFELIPDMYYTVIHWQESLTETPENVGGVYYSQKDVQTSEGQVTDYTAATTKTYTGFETPATVDQQEIKSDGSTVVNIYYNRLSYQIALVKGEGITSVSGEGTYKFEQTITISAEVENGYVWKEWVSGVHTNASQSYTFNVPADSIEYTATTTLQKYKVSIEAVYHGTLEQTTTVNLNEVTLKDTLTFKATPEVGYDLQITTVDGSEVLNDSGQFSLTDVRQNLSVGAIFVARSGIRYTVRFLQENLDASGELYDGLYYTFESSLEMTGTTDQMTAVDESTLVNKYDGYAVQTINQEVVLGDESTVVDVYFNRIEYFVTLSSDEGIKSLKLNGNDYIAPKKFKFGTEVEVKAETKESHTWDKWIDMADEKVGYANATHKIIVPINGIELKATSNIITFNISIFSGINGAIKFKEKTVDSGATDIVSVNYGTDGRFVFTPNRGYRVQSIAINSIAISTTDLNNAIETNEYRIQGIKADYTIDVNFTRITYEIEVAVIRNGKAVSGDTVIDPTAPKVLKVLFNDSLTISFVGDEGFRVKSVKIVRGKDSETQGELAEYEFKNVDCNCSLQVEFTIKTYKIEFEIKGGGSISCEMPLNIIEHGDNRTLVISKKKYIYAYDIYVNGKLVAPKNDQVIIQNIKEDIVVKAVFKDSRNFFGLPTSTWVIIITTTVFMICVIIFAVKMNSKHRKKKREGLLVENALNYEPEEGFVETQGGLVKVSQQPKSANEVKGGQSKTTTQQKIQATPAQNVQQKVKLPPKPTNGSGQGTSAQVNNSANAGRGVDLPKPPNSLKK